MLHEALMLEIYRQALNAGALPTARPRSTESANSSERCPSHDSNSSENGRENNGSGNATGNALANSLNTTFPAVPQQLPAQPPSMEAYLQMVAAAAQHYGFPLGAAATAATGGGHRLPLLLPTTDPAVPFKLPLQASPTASSNNSEALDFRTNLFERNQKAEPPASEDDDEEDDSNDINNPLDLSVGTRKRSADMENEPDSSIGQIQVKKIYKSESPPQTAAAASAAAAASVPSNAAPLLQNVNPYLAAVAAANIFRAGQFPDWNGKNDLVVDPLEKMSDIVKGPRKEKQSRSSAAAALPVPPQVPTSQSNSSSTTLPASNEGITKARHNIWQSHWQNKGVASSVFRCVWCKQSFSTLEALTTHMKDSKHCGVNVPPFGNLPNTDRHHHHHQHQQSPQQQQQQQQQQQSNAQQQHSHNLRKQHNNSGANSGPSAAAKAAFQYRGDQPTPLPRKLVRGQNVWLGKGVEQAMQILKCMRCGESFRSLGEMTKHMQETQHYTNILSQDQTMSMKNSSANSSGENKEGQNSLSSEESRTLSAVLTCKVCDKAFNSLGDLSNHMAKNNHYAEPLMQSMTGGGGVGNRKRPAPKKREKSLPVRKLLEMKGAQNEAMDSMEVKMQRNFDNNKRMSLDGTGIGPGAGEKSDAALFAERMRQYISGVKADEAAKAAGLGQNNFMPKGKSPEVEPKNGTTKSNAGTSSVLSAIEHMFTTSFDTPPPRQASLPATSPSNSSTKNTSPVASSILKRLGIDENVDYNKPLIDTTDPYYQHYRYTSSERSGSECSAEIHVEPRKMNAPTPEKMQVEAVVKAETKVEIKREHDADNAEAMETESTSSEHPAAQNVQIKTEEPKSPLQSGQNSPETTNGNADPPTTNNNNNNNYNKERSVTPPKSTASSPLERTIAPRSPTGSHRSATPKSPASSIKSYDGDKKYPSDSLNALSSMFDSLGSTGTATGGPATRSQLGSLKIESPENLSTTNSLAALRQFCVKKEKTA